MSSFRITRRHVSLLIGICVLVVLTVPSTVRAASPYDSYGIMWTYQEAERRYDGAGALVAPNEASQANQYGHNLGVGATGIYVTSWMHEANNLTPAEDYPSLLGEQSHNGGWHNVVGKLDRYGNVVWADMVEGTAGNMNQSYSRGVTVSGDEVYFSTYARFDLAPNPDPAVKDGPSVIKYDSDGNREIVIQALGYRVPDQGMPGGNSGTNGWPTQSSVDASGNFTVGGYSNGSYTDYGLTYAGTLHTEFLPDGNPNPNWGKGVEDKPFIFKYDSAGNFVSGLQYSASTAGDTRDRPYGLAVDGSGNTYVAGYTVGVVPGGTAGGGNDAFLSKYDASYNLVRTQQLGAAGNDILRWIQVDGDGNVIFAGYMADGFAAGNGSQTASGNDAYVRKVAPDGTLIWDKLIDGGGSNDYTFGLDLDADGNVLIGGRTGGDVEGTNAGGTDQWFQVLSGSDGSRITGLQYGTTADEAMATAQFDGFKGIVYQAGGTMGEYPGALGYPVVDGHADLTVQKITAGDFNGDGFTAWDDMLQMMGAVGTGGGLYDFDEDGDEDDDDTAFFMEQIFESQFGDFNFNGVIDMGPDVVGSDEWLLLQNWDPANPMPVPADWRGFAGPNTPNLVDQEEWDYLYGASAAVPEPSTFVLLALGLCGLAMIRRRRAAR
ncbi:MAG: PEP-CTERM sorting domain-containing protein [Planctomycetes bacterium]|nr:PEP-CTERM sorting domain-containing protein [Planctomycetota bacterium]